MIAPDAPLSARLFRLLADGRLHSGTALAQALGVTRSAVWKQVRQLEASGLPVVHQKRAGYRLEQALEPLDAASLRTTLQNRFPRLQVATPWCCASSNTEAARLLATDGRPAAVFCEWQQAGRGRQGRRWLSVPGASLAFSLAVRLPVAMQGLQGLPLLLGLEITRTLWRQGFSPARLKWPNDLVYWQRGRLCKFGGLLLELQGEMEGPVTLVAGLGLNLNLPGNLSPANPPGIAAGQGPVPLPIGNLAELGTVERNTLATELATAMLRCLQQTPACSLAGEIPAYDEAHALHQHTVRIFSGGETLSGRVAGINARGELLLEQADRRLTFAAGEISVRPNEPQVVADETAAD